MLTKPKGTYDLFGSDGKIFRVIESNILDIMDTYNYEYIKTPLFEDSSLFHRGVGETTDIVTKETYDFKDRGERSLTLRPEGTAGVVRAFIENKMYAQNLPKKFWYLGTMYRYERPQKGRYREFFQFGCEAFGSNSAMLDAEIISICVVLFESLGLKGIKVKINTLGDETSRKMYHDALVEYFKPKINSLCDLCKERFEKNPLRILDCKEDKESEALKNAPKTTDYLNEESRKHFEDVLKYLEALQINYEIDTKIVRGLDYYTHTVFEIEADIKEFGAQNVLCGGGRYNNLVSSLDGPKTPAVGFAIGIERLIQALKSENLYNNLTDGIDVFVIPISEKEKEYAFSINGVLRLMGFKSDIDYLDKSLNNNLKQADKLNARLSLIIGSDEVEKSYFTVRDMISKKDTKVLNKDLFDYIVNILSEEKVKGGDKMEKVCSCDETCDCGCNEGLECSCEECSCEECACEDDCCKGND